jgi:hypothetical protein
MANLALGLKPLETNWQNWPFATDGSSNSYTETTGFAAAAHPCHYTLDLGETRKVAYIRFKLWDGLGGNPNPRSVPDPRNYLFSLLISKSGKSFEQLYSTREHGGGNGWFAFRLLREVSIRFVTLECIHNDANEHFHIVEFEVHDTLPVDWELLNQRNAKYTEVIAGLLQESDVKEIVESTLLSQNQVIAAISASLKDVEQKKATLEDALRVVGLFKTGKSFLEEANKNKQNGWLWVAVSVIVTIIFTCTIRYFLWQDDRATTLLLKGKLLKLSESHTTLLVSFYYAGKAVLISVILFILGWSLKNFRSERHNYVINKHKALALMTANQILVHSDYKEIDRYEIFKQATMIIFSHQATGYGKEDQSNPNLVNSITAKP